MDENVGGTPLDDGSVTAPADDSGPRGRFSDMTEGDHVRDLLGVVAVVLSLQLPWSAAGGASTAPWALGAVLLLLVPLALPYVARLGALPAAWTVHTTRRARVLLALPAVGAATAQIVLDAVAVEGRTGVGAAVGIALTAAALAAVPRASELGPVSLDGAASRTWRNVTTVVGVLALAAPLAWLTLFVVEWFSVSEQVRGAEGLLGHVVIIVVATVLLVGGLVLPAVLASFSGSALWRRAAVVVAATWAAVLFATNDGSRFAVESVRALSLETRGDVTSISGLTNLGYGLVLVGAVAVLTTSPAVVRASRPEGDPAIGWFVTARGLLALVGVLAALLVASTVAVALDDFSPGLGALIPGAVVALVLGGLALKVRSMLVGRPADARRPALAATAALLGLGIVLVVVARLDDTTSLVPAWHSSLLTIIVGLGLPVGVLASLTLPGAVRAHIAANPATPRPEGSTSAYTWAPRSVALAAAQPAPGPAPSVPQGYPQAPALGGDTAAPGYGAPPATGTPVGDGAPASEAAPVGDGAPAAEAAPVVEAVGHGAPAPVEAGAPEPRATIEDTVLAVPTEAATPAASAPVEPLVAGSVLPAAALGDQVTEVLRLDADAAAVDRSSRSEAGFTWEQAIDPQTPATTLAQIAQDAPTLRAALAANPSTYPALLEWLGQLGDSEVDEALGSRPA